MYYVLIVDAVFAINKQDINTLCHSKCELMDVNQTVILKRHCMKYFFQKIYELGFRFFPRSPKVVIPQLKNNSITS